MTHPLLPARQRRGPDDFPAALNRGDAAHVREIRADDKLKTLPVVVLTSSREESDLARSWDLGVNAYVVKPVDSEQFFHAVKTLGRFWAVLNETPSE